MSDVSTNKQASAALVPTVTGNPVYDTVIRNSIIASSGAVAAVIVTWLNAHGFKDPNLSLMVSGAIAAIMSGGAAMVWGWWATHMSQNAIVNNTVHAALTGEVPVAVIAKATEAQAKAIDLSPTASVVMAPATTPIPPA